MPDAGLIVTNAEVLALVPTIKSISTKETFLIKGVEAAIEKFCQRSFASATYTDENVPIERGELRYYDNIVVPRRIARVKNFPITTWTSLKQVTARSSVTGMPSSTVTVARDAYYVNLNTGDIHLLTTISAYEEGTLLNAGLLTSWPEGVNTLLATYVAGYSAANMPADLKMIVLRVLARQFKLFDLQALHLDSVSGELGTTMYVSAELTEEDKRELRRFRRWSMV